MSKLKDKIKFIGKTDSSNMCLIDDQVVLTGKAAFLFEKLVENEDETISFESICEDVWQDKLTPKLNRSIDVHLHHVRKITNMLGYKIHRYRQEGLKLYDPEKTEITKEA